jgi:hypothetical protein
MRKVKAIQDRRWPLIHEGRISLFGLANYYHHFIQDLFFRKVATTLSDLLGKNGYSKNGIRFVTKPLEGLRASCFRNPYLSS